MPKMKCRLFAVFLFAANSSYALYNGNPSAPELPEDGVFIPKNSPVGIKVGYRGDYIFSRSMIVHSQDESASHQISSYSSFMNAATFAFNIVNRAEVYGEAGSYRLKLSQRVSPENSVHYRSDHHIAAIAGLRAIAAYWGETQLGVDVKGFISYPHIDQITLNGSSVSSEGAKMSDRQWQIGMGLSHHVSCFIPYIGLTYSHVRMKASGLSSLKEFFPNKHVRFWNKYSFGLVFGFGLAANKGFSCNLEAKIIEEVAASLSADFKF